MKRLFIVRHAKSSWDYPYLSDYERPLNNRGKRNLPDMAKRFQLEQFPIDLIISSPAERAITTARGFASALGISNEEIRQEERFFHASRSSIKEIISRQSTDLQSIMVFGHNPGLTYLIHESSDFYLDNLPTCAICGIEFQFESWKDILNKKGKKFYYDFPKSGAE